MAKKRNNWLIDSIRLSLFTEGAVSFNSMSNWAKEITGFEPDQIQKTAQQFTSRTLFGDKILELNANNSRIDFLIKSQETSAISNIGNSSNFTELFQLISSKITELENWPIAKRVAIGSTVNIPVKNAKEANTNMLKILPNAPIDINNSEDFQFRINRIFKSNSSPHTYINRLVTWQNVQLTQIKVEFILHGNNFLNSPVQPTPDPEFKPQLVNQIVFDVNTKPMPNKLFQAKTQIQLIEEMAEIISFTSVHGDKIPAPETK